MLNRHLNSIIIKKERRIDAEANNSVVHSNHSDFIPNSSSYSHGRKKIPKKTKVVIDYGNTVYLCVSYGNITE